MSLFGALSTAISGLSAQAAAFSNISDNAANSQTVGYKRVQTNFIDYLTTSSATQNQSGSVVTRPQYLNDVQGSIEQSANPLALAINGDGFFAVSSQSGKTQSGLPLFARQQYYTRAGDFALDKNGYIANSAGYFLKGWNVDPATGIYDTTTLAPIRVSQTQFQPVATSQVTLLANVPTTPSLTSNLKSQVQVYDATGTAHELDTAWAQTGPQSWTLTLSSPDNQPATTIGSVDVTFGANGTLASLSNPTGTLANSSTSTFASVDLSPTFKGVSQKITLNLGTIGGTDGVTQFAGTDYDLRSITQNGSPPGSFTGISTTPTGDLQANYDNGHSVTIARVPVITFENANALQRENGQAFIATNDSGVPIAQNQNQNGAGSFVTGSVENSNVDIATELSKLIVAQQAYGANAKVITTANQLLQTTLDLKQ